MQQTQEEPEQLLTWHPTRASTRLTVRAMPEPRAARALPTSQAAGHVWTGCPVATYSR
jgi:hypothetical protein